MDDESGVNVTIWMAGNPALTLPLREAANALRLIGRRLEVAAEKLLPAEPAALDKLRALAQVSGADLDALAAEAGVGDLDDLSARDARVLSRALGRGMASKP